MSGSAETVTLRVTLRHATLDEFIERHAEHVSSAGLFVRTRSPKAAGTKVHFELKLADGSVALKGTGVVVSVRTDERPGMGLRFSELEADSQAVVDRIVDAHGEGPLAPTPLALKLPGSTTDILRRGWATGDLSPSWPVADYSGVSATGPLRSPSDVPQPAVPRASKPEPRIPSESTMPPFESASADLDRDSSSPTSSSLPAKDLLPKPTTEPEPDPRAPESAPGPAPARSDTVEAAEATSASFEVPTDDVDLPGGPDPTPQSEPGSEAEPAPAAEAVSAPAVEAEPEDLELEFEDAIGFEEPDLDPGWNEPTRVEETLAEPGDETSFAGLLDSSPQNAPLEAADGEGGPKAGAGSSEGEGPTGDLSEWPDDADEDARTLSGEEDAFEAVTEMVTAEPPSAASNADVDVDVDLGSGFPEPHDGDHTHETSEDEAGHTDPQIRLDSGLQEPAPRDRSMDLVEDEIRAVGIDVDARRIRVGTLERREFRWLTPAVGLPALVAVTEDGRRVAGTRAERRAEESPSSAVAPMELLLAVRDGAIGDPSLPVLDWGPRGGRVQLGGLEVSAYELLVELARCIHETIAESLSEHEGYRAFVSLPPDLDDGCVALLRTAFREASLPVAEFDSGPRPLLTAFGMDEAPDRLGLVISIDETRTQITVVRGLRPLAEAVVEDVSARTIDDHIVGLIITALLQHSQEDHRGDTASQIRLREAVALARNDIRRTPQVDVETALPGPEGRLVPRAFKLDRTQIYQATEQTTGRLHEHAMRILREAGIDPRSLGAVILAGEGATFPPFEQALSRLCDREPSTTAPPVQARVLGLAKLGQAVERDLVARRPDTLNESVGVGLPGDRFKVLVPAGAKLPARVLRVQPLRASQTDFVLDLLQGNGERSSSCTPLGEVALRELPKSKNGLKIEMELSVGENGILDVRLREPSSGQERTARFATSQATEQLTSPELEETPEDAEPSKGFLGRLFGRG